jgi:RhtX/FptX family siderophore transporter
MTALPEAAAATPTGPMSPRRLYTILVGLYVAQAIPIYLIIAALPAILREIGVSRSFIGAFGVLLVPWVFKFVWAPLVDRHSLSRRLGRRRSWILPALLVNIALIVAMSFLVPDKHLIAVFAITLAVACVASTQDIATDGFAVEMLSAKQRALGNAIQGASIAAGVLIGSSLALIVYDRLGWQTMMLAIAAIAALTALPVLLMREAPPAAEDGGGAGPRPRLGRASLMAFLRRSDALQLLAFALFYRVSEGFVKAMEQPFLVDKGLSLSLVGLTSGASAATVGLAGSVAAALVIRKLGLFSCLYGLGLARTVCFACFTLAAASQGIGAEWLIAIAFLNTVIRYMEVVGLCSLYMGASSPAQPATDFTLLTSAQLLVYMLGSFASGVLADWLGYTALFALATALSLLGLVWCMRRIPRDHPGYATR